MKIEDYFMKYKSKKYILKVNIIKIIIQSTNNFAKWLFSEIIGALY